MGIWLIIGGIIGGAAGWYFDRLTGRKKQEEPENEGAAPEAVST